MKLKKYSQGNKDSPSSPHISSCSILGKVKRTVRPCDTNTDWLAQHIWEAHILPALCARQKWRSKGLLFSGAPAKETQTPIHLPIRRLGKEDIARGPALPPPVTLPWLAAPHLSEEGFTGLTFFPQRDLSYPPYRKQNNPILVVCSPSKNFFLS